MSESMGVSREGEVYIPQGTPSEVFRGSNATHESGLGVHGQVVTYPPTLSLDAISQGNHSHPVQQPQTSLWAEATSQEGSPPLLIAQGPGVFGAAVPGPQPLPFASLLYLYLHTSICICREGRENAYMLLGESYMRMKKMKTRPTSSFHNRCPGA